MNPEDLIPADATDHHLISRFLFEEAELLDNREYDAWLRLFDDEFEYVAPLRRHRQQEGLNDPWSVEQELGGDDELPISMHNRASLQANIARIQTGRTISDIPAWFTERFISNILVDVTPGADGYFVRSKFMVQRYKLGREQIICGHRQDRLIKKGARYLIKSRRVIFSSDVYRWATYVFI